MDINITPVDGDKWSIRVERKHNGHSASGQVVVIQSSAPTADDAPHLPYAGARAWLALAQARQAAGDSEGAIASAQAGLDELGQRYYSSSLHVKDDTALHIDLAQDLVAEGRSVEAARTLIQALDSRVQLYAKLHAETIAE